MWETGAKTSGSRKVFSIARWFKHGQKMAKGKRRACPHNEIPHQEKLLQVFDGGAGDVIGEVGKVRGPQSGSQVLDHGFGD